MVFVLLTATLLVAVFLFIYYFAQRYTENEFYFRLNKRATIAAQAYLEEDEVSVNIYEDIRKTHLQILPDEKEKVYKVNIADQRVVDPSKNVLPASFFKTVFREKRSDTIIGEHYYTGILYQDNQGDFIITLSARDLYGRAKMKNLRNILIVASFLGLTILFFLGRFYAKQVLLPITTITDKVNSIKAKNLHLRLDAGKNKDELTELALTFNNMLDRLDTSFEMQSNFIQNASHELKTH